MTRRQRERRRDRAKRHAERLAFPQPGQYLAWEGLMDNPVFPKIAAVRVLGRVGPDGKVRSRARRRATGGIITPDRLTRDEALLTGEEVRLYEVEFLVFRDLSRLTIGVVRVPIYRDSWRASFTEDDAYWWSLAELTL